MRYISLDVDCSDSSTSRMKFNTDQISTWRDNEISMANGVVYSVRQTELEITSYIKAASFIPRERRQFTPRQLVNKLGEVKGEVNG